MLESKRLIYDFWTENDYKELKDILGNPAVCEFLPGNKQKSDEELQKWLNFYVRSNGDAYGNRIYKVILKDTQEVIGYGGLCYVKEFEKIEIMYGFKEEAWGKGFATEVGLHLKTLAKELNYNSLIALADIHNEGSNRVLEKIGYTKIKQIHLWGLDLFYYEMEI